MARSVTAPWRIWPAGKLADMALFLALDGSNCVNGAEFLVDGGEVPF
jgi:hypothetical protein